MSIRLSRSQVEDLHGLCAIDLPAFEEAARALGRLRRTIRRSEIRHTLESAVGSQLAPALDRFLIAIATVQRRGRGTKTEILDAVSEQIAEISGDIDTALLKRWGRTSTFN
jgi:hypothetical protein